jgi:hypothetical protein
MTSLYVTETDVASQRPSLVQPPYVQHVYPHYVTPHVSADMASISALFVLMETALLPLSSAVLGYIPSLCFHSFPVKLKFST